LPRSLYQAVAKINVRTLSVNPRERSSSAGVLGSGGLLPLDPLAPVTRCLRRIPTTMLTALRTQMRNRAAPTQRSTIVTMDIAAA
jgi:hypothetical protein